MNTNDTQAPSDSIEANNAAGGDCVSRLVRPLRAKDMAALFDSSPTPETLVKIACAMDAETSEILKERGIKTDSSFLSLLKEQDQKWQAFARRCPDVNPLAFRLVMKKLHPTTAAFAWPNAIGEARADNATSPQNQTL